jgi:hypothetical protein
MLEKPERWVSTGGSLSPYNSDDESEIRRLKGEADDKFAAAEEFEADDDPEADEGSAEGVSSSYAHMSDFHSMEVREMTFPNHLL